MQTSSGSRPAEAVFYLNVALVIDPWLRWLRETDDPAALADPLECEGAVQSRVLFAPLNERWTSTPAQAAERGAEATAAVLAAFPDWLPLLGDRKLLLDRLESGEQLPGTTAEEALRAVLHQDAGNDAETRRDIAEIAAWQPDSPFVVWVEQRLDTRS